MLQTILFTHDDLDGAGCRIIFELAHHDLTKGVDYDIINCANANVDDKVNEALEKDDYITAETDVCFGDICASSEVLSKLMELTNGNVKIWDHHRTNFPATLIVPNAQIIPENDLGKMECGTSIMYKHYCDLAFHHEHVSKFQLFRDDGNRKILLSTLVETLSLIPS